MPRPLRRALALTPLLALLVTASALGASTSGCGAPHPKVAKPKSELRELQLGGRWLPENRAAINAFLRDKGRFGHGYDAARKPVAVFDWDNTVMKNDAGDATFFWMLRHEKIQQPPGRDWGASSRQLTYEAKSAITVACSRAAEAGKPLATVRFPECADALLGAYLDGTTANGFKAWTEESTATNHAAYAWAAKLMAGYTLDEIRGFAREALTEAKGKPIGATQTVGSRAGLPAGVKVYDEMHDLIGALQDDGFDVWIISASPQQVVEVAAEEVGIDRAHVVGIRTQLDDQLRATAHLTGCDTVADGLDTMIPFDQGKRCWINRAIFELPTNAQLRPAQEAWQHPALAAGDSDGDVAMVQYASTFKLVLNRGRVALMCNAYANAGGRWHVQPMFIAPATRRSQPFPCSTTADSSGSAIVDETGAPMSDQVDRVYALP